ncbi:AMIN-like domain-containing (lipo)protein [Cellulomonas cellasea]|uniref:AMIN-like domain-containing protein n=2 Tax=Cellulomonas cellasea TaxID=43670 RepID=A0A0A0B8J9_9CELL|nr:hypothetical protein [Cellulomonas cellasea]KGM03210.1 hypothetical protein Q760_08620 [Cellulomonas cellasea DSM 20118]GEA89791.1 hypothetical protein CCE01nite_37400 [Cellulomonas cellasea]
MRRRLSAVLATLLLLVGGQLLVAPGAAAHPYCGLVWGSQARSAGDLSAGTLVNVRAGRHACFDRLVLDVDAPLTGWSVRYVDRLVDSSGADVRGGARLEVVARVPALATDSWFVGPGTIVEGGSSYRTLRHVAWVSIESGVSTLGYGVRARLPFRAFVLPGPGDGSRLVVDVAHRWCDEGHRVC